MKKNSNWVENYRRHNEFEESDDYSEQEGGANKIDDDLLYVSVFFRYQSFNNITVSNIFNNRYTTFSKHWQTLGSPPTPLQNVYKTYFQNLKKFTSIVDTYFRMETERLLFLNTNTNPSIKSPSIKSITENAKHYDDIFQYSDMYEEIFFVCTIINSRRELKGRIIRICPDRVEVYKRISKNSDKNEQRLSYLIGIAPLDKVTFNFGADLDGGEIGGPGDNTIVITGLRASDGTGDEKNNSATSRSSYILHIADTGDSAYYKEAEQLNKIKRNAQQYLSSSTLSLLDRFTYSSCVNKLMEYIKAYLYQLFNKANYENPKNISFTKQLQALYKIIKIYLFYGIATNDNSPYDDTFVNKYFGQRGKPVRITKLDELNILFKLILNSLKAMIKKKKKAQDDCFESIDSNIGLLTDFISGSSTSGSPPIGGYSDSETSIDSFVNRESETSVDSFVNRESDTSVDSFVNRESDTSVDSFVNRESNNELVGGSAHGHDYYDVKNILIGVRDSFTQIIKKFGFGEYINTSNMNITNIIQYLYYEIDSIKAFMASLYSAGSIENKTVKDVFDKLVEQLEEYSKKNNELKFKKPSYVKVGGAMPAPAPAPAPAPVINAMQNEIERLRTELAAAEEEVQVLANDPGPLHVPLPGQHHANVAAQHHDNHHQQLNRAHEYLRQIQQYGIAGDIEGIRRVANDALGHHNAAIRPSQRAIKKLHMDLADSHGNLEKELKEQKDETERYKKDKYALINYGQQLGMQGTMLSHSLNNKVIQANNLRYHYKRQRKLTKFYKKIFKEKNIRRKLTKKQLKTLQDFEQREAKDLKERVMEEEDENLDISPLSGDSDDDVDFSDSSFAETSSEYELVRT